MDDNGLLLIAAVLIASIAEFFFPFFMVLVGWHRYVPSFWVRLFVTWPLAIMVLYGIFYIAYRLFYNSYP